MRVKTLSFLLCMALVYTAKAQISSTFNTNNEGWIVTDVSGGSPHTVVYNPTGGNPGGYLSTSISLSTSMYWRAPAKFLGDHCQNSYGSNLKFDLQLSAPGNITNASTVYGNLRISCSYGYTIVANVSSIPAVAPGWTSYSVKLDETTTWMKANTTGPIATHREVVEALSSITVLEIVAQAAFGSDPDVNIDNIILEQNTLATPPSITSFTPQNGVPGTDIIITGNNFNTTPSNSTVYFGSVKATVLNASSTQLTVKVPNGATYSPLTVADKVAGLSASTGVPFQPRYDNNKDFGGQIIRASLAPEIHFDLEGVGTNAVGDLDGDGWNDIVVGEGNGGAGITKQFSVYRNAGVPGAITLSAFQSKVSFPLSNAYVKAFIALADFDSDGKLDVAISSASTFNAYVTVFRNTSTPGNISFGPEQNLLGYSYSDGPITTADMDGDGKPEIVCVFNNNCATGDRLYIYPNRSTPGNIDFCGLQTFGPVLTCGGHVTVGDLDGDNFPDVVVDASTLTVFRNTSAPGDLSLAAPFVLTTTAGGKPVIADLDNDGKADLAWPYGTLNIEIRKNMYSGGTFDASSFSPQILITTPVYTGSEVIASDINSDGKMDLVMTSANDITIAQNVSTPGILTSDSFLPGVPFSVNSGTAYNISPLAADFNGDNKPDIIARTSNTTPRKLLIYQNECYPAPRIDNLSASSGSQAGSVTLTGDYFSTGTSPISFGWLGPIKATITPSSNTTATATIPNSISGQFSFSEHGLTAFSKKFHVLFNTNRTIDATSFGAGIDFAMAGAREAIAIADFDKDGKPDVAVTDGNSKIFRNTHSPAGTSITSASLTQEAAVYSAGNSLIALDIDGDGLVDLNNGYGLNQNNSTPGTIAMLNGTNGAYTNAGGFNYAAAADFNKDGKTDLALSNGTAFVQLYENTSAREPFIGSSIFSPFGSAAVNLVRTSNYGGIVAADFNDDGYDDLATTTPFTDNLTLYQNQKLYGPLKTTSFSAGTTITTGDEPRNLTASDFDGDGKIDLAITHYGYAFISVYRNTSTASSISFAAPVDIPCNNKGHNITSQDLDGDGKAEIIVVFQPNPGPGSFSIAQNTSTSGNISFNTPVNYPLTSPARNPFGVTTADINLDQKPDILITTSPWGAGTFALVVFENKISSGPVVTILQQPADNSICDGATATFNTDATGATNITYQWQFSPNTGVFTDIADGGGYSGVTTKSLSVNSTGLFGAGRYRCKISGDLATTVFTNDEGLFITAIPNAPTTTGDADCVPATLALTASGGTNGQYRWYDVATGGVAITGQTNGTFITPVINTTTTYYASIRTGACESTRTPAVATIAPLAKPTVNSSQPIVSGNVNFCDGESTILTAPSGFTTYTWSNGESTQQITVDQDLVVSVIVTDAAACVSPSSEPLTVIENPFPVATITIIGVQLTASIGDSYQWYESGDLIPGATDQTLDFNILEYGLYTVDVTDNGCTSTSLAFTYFITPIESQNHEWKIYPNPFSSELSIESPSSKDVEIEITDVTGRIVKREFTANHERINLEALSAGQYMLTIHAGTQTIQFRIIKSK